jgi:hypothetical protein
MSPAFQRCPRCGVRQATEEDRRQFDGVPTRRWRVLEADMGPRCWSSYGSFCPQPPLDALALLDELAAVKAERDRLAAYAGVKVEVEK